MSEAGPSSPSASASPSPWMTIAEAAAYARRGKRFLRREVHGRRLRACIVGGRQQLMFRAEWLDAWLESLATPVPFEPRRRA